MHATAQRAGSGRQRRVSPVLLLLLVLASVWSGSAPVAAQPATPAAGCLTATEPNDQPADAMPLPAGESCVTAASDRAAQDLYRWTVPDDAAPSRWTIALSAIPGQVARLEVYTVELDDAGQVATATLLVSASGQLDQPVAHEDLLWRPGAYYIAVATSGPGAYTLSVTAGASLPGAGDPNAPATGEFAISATADGSAPWTVDEADAGTRWTLRLQGAVTQALTLRMTDETGATLLTAPVGPDGIAEVPDVGLPPGTYALAVTGSGEDGAPWALSATASGERAAGEEDEPNELGAGAMPLVLDGDAAAVSGRLAMRGPADLTDRDVYRLDVDTASAGRFTDVRLLWQGEIERRLCLLDPAETELRCVTGTGGAALSDLVLAEGEYLVAVSGRPAPDVPYVLRVDITGEAVSGFEAEPNERPEQATALAPDGDGFAGGGRLASGDVDHFRVTVAGEPQLWRIAVAGAGVTEIDLLDATGSEIMTGSAGADGLAIDDAYLVPGDHVVRLNGAGDYRVTLTALGPPDPRQEREPNGTLDRSQPIRLAEERTGRLVTSGDTDVYRFSLQGETVARIEVTSPADGQVAMALDWQGVGVAKIEPVAAGEPVVYTGTLQAGDYAIWLQPRVPSEAFYTIRIDPLDPYQPPEGTPAAAPVTVALDLGTAPVAAYWPDAQRLSGEVTLENPGDADLEVALDARAGNPHWEVALDAGTVALDAGETVTVPVEVLVAPDARADEPVYVAVRAAAPEGAASAMALVTPDGQAQPLAPEAWWPLPDDLLGGIDVAWSALGAAPVAADEAAATAQAPLHDGMTTTGAGWWTDVALLPAELTVDLAGDDPVPVAGFAIFPAGTEPGPGAQPREVELQLSADGTTFETAWSGALAPVAEEQAFALDAPVEARYARLRIVSAQDAASAYVSFGEWKVIATPGWEPAGPRNIADPALGGHVVDIQPPPADPLAGRETLLPGEAPQTVTAAPGSDVSLVIGFQHDRAAQVTALEWVDPPGTDPTRRLERVTVAVSTGSPVGPWTELGAWEIERDASGEATYALDAPAWARFVRITGTAPGEGDAPVDVELPDVIRAIERPAGDGYLSVTGEWGGDRATAIYERLVPAERPEPGDDAGDDAEAATVLPLGETRADVAAIGADEDWYRVELPAGMTDLSVTIGGVPAIGVEAELFDAGGDPVKATVEQVSATELRVTARGEPGAAYLLRVTQPPTSVVIAFDTSFSIGPYETTVYQGLNRFATEVQPGREFVAVLPFGAEVLPPGWSDDPYVIQGAVAAYPRTATSSDGEGAILTAGEALKDRPGTRAIVLITDGESGPTPDQMAKLWPELAATGPRIFTVGIAGSDQAARGQDVMQDWATVGGGGYVYVRDQGQMDVAFARVATELRRPALYTVAAEASAPPPTPTPAPTPTPEPTSTPAPTAVPTPAADGTLRVVAPPQAPGQPAPATAGTQGQVAIILDTSGSMLQPLEGGTRADVAKAALIDLVTTTIPPGTTVSLRTFGDTPDSCETLLAVPAGPLDPAAMSQTIADLPVVDLVRTPIGAALEATLTDLAAGEGPKIVVLVTDGEETCGGDPAAAIQALVDSGVDVRVNIVGFAIDDPALAATFEDWARLGNGQYIDAGNAAELNAAVAAAVQPAFDVVDASGAVVASGQVGGEPVALPPGTYTVVIHTDPGMTSSVTVASGQETTLTLPPLP